ncbi:endo alpha-1,4 polygalactosaminidase, partial [Nonomuraea sp. RK-328]|nr:endo alpha-1,4 polygalactosaminidase [Nonomuraea sp. RK-328]
MRNSPIMVTAALAAALTATGLTGGTARATASASAGAAGAAALPAPVACNGCYTSWQWQLSSLPARPFLDVQNDTGFPLSASDQLAYNAWLANEAHRRGLSVALKNDVEQIPRLLPYYDFALNEECWSNAECTTAQNDGEYGYDQFVQAGKAVFQVEYALPVSRFCPRSNAQ